MIELVDFSQRFLRVSREKQIYDWFLGFSQCCLPVSQEKRTYNWNFGLSQRCVASLCRFMLIDSKFMSIYVDLC